MITHNFIEIGKTITLEGHRCKAVENNFKLEAHLNDMSGGLWNSVSIRQPPRQTLIVRFELLLNDWIK
jgi:hypothetical protein